MNISNVKKRTEVLTITANDETAIVKVYPDEQTPAFEDERRRMIFDNDVTGSQLLAYTIGTLVADWDLIITVSEEERKEHRAQYEIEVAADAISDNPRGVGKYKELPATRKLDPKNPADVALIPLSILNEITKGVSELNRPGEPKEETSSGSFS